MEQNKQGTALLVMDMQISIFSQLANADHVIAETRRAIDNAHQKGIPVIYVVVGFRQSSPEISSNNKSFAVAKEMFANVNMQDFIKIHPLLQPLENELTVIKRRVSAFAGSDLEVVLRSFNINHLVLAGIATSGVVLSTLRQAADKDYKLTVLSDCCADRDLEVHEILMQKVFSRQADVFTAEEWINS
ncbi:isochorismatase family cysteine hydrolase [Danxiaibacter flavus]|uniref:Isochorismatase family cysteine hydrolase n=1 Tax=Danxiaibacter flavus TaxID=3049108 RepID=A0ABV3ZI13_9BACT|nr:isochorismatase family cysteine hydrolase [Chitinophagaceae bacterium DXS]